MPTPPERPLCSLPAAAREVGISHTTLYRWLNEGSIPATCVVKLGGRIHIRRGPFLAFIERGELPSGETPQLRAVS